MMCWGANVIFYWEEKDACMEHYGPSTRLMLDEENAYGQICYSPAELTEALRKEDGAGQKQAYVENYRKILEYQNSCVHILLKRGKMRIEGEHLMIVYYSRDEMKVTGQIQAVFFE